MRPEARARELQRPRVRQPEHGEGDQRGDGHRRDAVDQHFDPGGHLAHFLPPLEFDDEAGGEARAGDQEEERDDQQD